MSERRWIVGSGLGLRGRSSSHGSENSVGWSNAGIDLHGHSKGLNGQFRLIMLAVLVRGRRGKPCYYYLDIAWRAVSETNPDFEYVLP